MSDIRKRLQSLSDYVASRQPPLTMFILANGSEFETPLSPEEYLLKYGAYTPNGQRIVRYPHPVKGVDSLSLSLYEMIDEAVKIGKLVYSDLESDEL